MDESQNGDTRRLDPVDEPIILKNKLADTSIFKLGYHAAAQGKLA
jgi:hypothetical protein